MPSGKTLILPTELVFRSETGEPVRANILNTVSIGRPDLVGETRDQARARLTKAFNEVCDPDNWKMPIDAVIPAARRSDVEEAIAYFTGSPATFEPTSSGDLRVRAPGYYLSVGA